MRFYSFFFLFGLIQSNAHTISVGHHCHDSLSSAAATRDRRKGYKREISHHLTVLKRCTVAILKMHRIRCRAYFNTMAPAGSHTNARKIQNENKSGVKRVCPLSLNCVLVSLVQKKKSKKQQDEGTQLHSIALLIHVLKCIRNSKQIYKNCPELGRKRSFDLSNCHIPESPANRNLVSL